MNSEHKGDLIPEEVLEQIMNNKGKIVASFNESDFGRYFITGPVQGGADIKMRVGRLVQVRLEDGDYGSDIVLMRHCEDTLMQHANQWFYEVENVYLDKLNELFKDVFKDSTSIGYTLNHKKKRKGVIIPSRVKKGKSTPLRDIKMAIDSKINSIVNQ